MAETEIKMLDEELNYEVLAQIYTIINDNITKKCIAMEKVLQKDFDINYRVPSSKCPLPNIADCTALDFALDKRELDVFKMLIGYGADFTCKNQIGDTILHRIVQISNVKNKPCYELRGKLENTFVEPVLSAHIEFNNATNPTNLNGISHFHIACMFNHTGAVNWFLKQGISVNEAISDDSKVLPGYTPLHLTARYSAYETAKVLLDHNANVNSKDFNGRYTLDLLVERKIEILDWRKVHKNILQDTLKVEFSTNDKFTRLLLEKANTHEVGLSRCHIACTLKDAQILEQILAEGVNLNDPVDQNSPLWPGYTALHFSAICNIEAVKLLLANGANLLAKNVTGITPWDLCLERYSPDAIHSIITLVPQLNNITFFNTNIKLSDLILAMSEEGTLRTFLQEIAESPNMSLPFDSPIWPGYTILHIAIILSTRICIKDDLYENTNYTNEWNFGNYTEYKNKDYLRKIDLCLTMGADVTITDFHNSTPLHLAFRLQNRHIVKLLFQYHHKIVNIVDSENLSHLHIACALDQNDLVEKLLQTGIDVNQPIMSTFDYRLSKYNTPYILHINPGWTCLHIAIVTANEELVEILIKYGADLYAEDSYGMTAIHQVLRAGSRSFGRSILSRKPYENRVTNFGLTHLHVACFFGDLEAVDELLSQGADIEATINYTMICSIPALNFLDQFNGYTPLHFALSELDADVIKLLVQCNVNLFAKSADGSVPFYKAIKNSYDYQYFGCGISEDDDGSFMRFYDNDYDGTNVDKAKKFAMKLFNVDKIGKLVKEDTGITKLHIACYGIQTEVAIDLLNNGADSNAQISMDSPIWPGCTPLHILMIPRFTIDDDYCNVDEVYGGITKIVMLLINYGASVMLRDAKGNTPIHKAPEIFWSHPNIIYSEMSSPNFMDWILQGHIDFNVNPVDARGISHFDVACMTHCHTSVERFLKQGINVNRRFGHFTRYGGFTALHVASFYKDDTIFNLLLQNGANPNAKDFLGNTPIHTAATIDQFGHYGLYQNTEIIYKLLLNNGADAEARNLWNETPLAVILRMNMLTNETLHTFFDDYTCRANIFNVKNQGLLGIALHFRSTDKNIEEECFYKAIVGAPDLNKADELGRTVIHNVVSVYISTGSVEDYFKIIHGFVKLDFDIDCQDNEGQTALHMAVRFRNYNAIVGLLMNGADINIVDSTAEPAFSYIFECKDDHIIRRSILEACFLHVYKLQIAGLEISKVNQNLVEMIKKESISYRKETQRCSKELDNLKKHIISSSFTVTMYNLLSETITYFRMMVFLRDTVDEIFTNIDVLRVQYPQFVGLLQMQYRNVFVRLQLVDPAKNSLDILTGFAVPDLCSDKILKFLKNKDLKQIVAATDL